MTHGDRLRRLEAKTRDEAAKVLGYAVLGCKADVRQRVIELFFDGLDYSVVRNDLFLVMETCGFDVPEPVEEEFAKVIQAEQARIERQRISAERARRKRAARAAFEKSWTD